MDKIEGILSKIDYKSFYTKHIQNFEANGKTNVKILCVFHKEDTPSLNINLETGEFNCFGCHAGGHIIQFVQHRYGLTYKEALNRIKKEEGIKSASELAPERKPKSETRTQKPVVHTLQQVDLIHRQFLKNETILETFQDKRGLSMETIVKYHIGYQNEHFVIPIEFEPSKWALKEHKGGQSLGNKVSLYPPGIIKDGLPYVIIAEGEFKALLLNQLGFPAVSGTGGAGTWKKEWNAFFTNHNVIIAYDADEPGRGGSTKVAESLRGVAKSVKVVQWPSYMDSKDRKDVTDFFVTLGKTPEDFQRLIDNAKEMVFEVKEIDGIRFVEPAGFRVEENCVYQIICIREKLFEQKPICYTPVFITQRAVDVDSGLEEVEITFKRDGKRKKIWVAKQVVSDMKKILELSNHGLPVNSRNAGRMIEYLAAFEAFNMQIIPKTFISKGAGFKLVEGKRVFILAKMVGRKAARGSKEVSVEFSPEVGFERFSKALKPEGTYQKWREWAEPALKYPYATLAFYASFATPLLRMLKAPNFIVDFWATTSLGKTTVLELAASVWGNPHREGGGLVFGWDNTKVFLERMANFFCDIPIFPDDSTHADSRVITNAIYMIANGIGKGRGSFTGIRQTPTWHTICISSGEGPLIERCTYGGARARTISLFGTPFPDARKDFVDDFKLGLRENHGHAGVKYVEGLLSIYDNPNKITSLMADYKMYQRALSIEANSEVGNRVSWYFAIIKVAVDLVYEILGIGDPVAAKESIDRVFAIVVDESLENVDVGVRSMEYILSWANANEAFFKSGTNESYGKWKDFDYIGIWKHKLGEILKKENYSESAILRSWAGKEWIKREDKSFLCNRDGKRLVIIPWDVIRKFQEK